MKREGFRFRYFVIILGFAGLMLLMRDLNNRMAALRRLELEANRVSLQYTQMVGTRDALQTEVAIATAMPELRSSGGKNNEGLPGDVLIVPVPVGETSQQTAATPTPAPAPLEKWEFWLAMFFDKP